MSAVGLKLVTLLCFSCTALSDPDRCQVVWNKAGETATIKCRTSDMTLHYLDLCKGLCENDKVIYADSQRSDIVPALGGRAHINGTFPNLDISIENLTSADTALYWCVYKTFDARTSNIIKKSGGSVVLVVTEDVGGSANGNQACETDHQKLLLVAVVSSAVVLLCIILGTCIWITLKTKSHWPSEKPRRVPNNEVYEDMRSTIRR